MSRRFFHISLGILALALSYYLGSQIPAGHPPFLPSPAAAGVVLDGDVGIVSQWAEWMLDSNGDTWNASFGCWNPGNSVPLPFPVSELKFWHPTVLVTKNNVVWKVAGNSWESCGEWPGGPVSADRTSWGTIKGKYSK